MFFFSRELIYSIYLSQKTWFRKKNFSNSVIFRKILTLQDLFLVFKILQSFAKNFYVIIIWVQILQNFRRKNYKVFAKKFYEFWSHYYLSPNLWKFSKEKFYMVFRKKNLRNLGQISPNISMDIFKFLILSLKICF